MKLYATITSERASKSQGGNEWIETILSVDRVSKVRLYMDADAIRLYGGENGSILLYEQHEKGKRQKGEMCAYCERPATRERDGHEKVCDEH